MRRTYRSIEAAGLCKRGGNRKPPFRESLPMPTAWKKKNKTLAAAVDKMNEAKKESQKRGEAVS